MSNINDGNPQPVEQPVAGPQQQPGQPAPQQVAQPVAADPTPQPTVEELQRQLAERDQRLQQLDESARYHQSNADRYQNALKVALGQQPSANQPPQDPIAPFVQKLVSQGYSPESARAVASTSYEMTQAMMAPIQQQVQVAQQYANITPAIDQAAARMPGLFTSQQDYQDAREAASYLVQNGGVADPTTILSMVNDARFRRQMNNPNPQNYPAPATVPQNQPQPFARGMYNTAPGFTQPSYQQPPQQLTQEQQAAQDFILNRFKPKS